MVKFKKHRKITCSLKMAMFEYPNYKRMIENDEIKNFKFYEHINNIIESIEEALDIFEEDYHFGDRVGFIRRHYFEKPLKSLQALAIDYNYAYETVRQWESDFFELLGQCLGWVD